MTHELKLGDRESATLRLGLFQEISGADMGFFTRVVVLTHSHVGHVVSDLEK